MKPQIGSIVCWEGQGKTYPAIVIEVKDEGRLALCVFRENTTQFLPVVYFSENKEPGCWSVPAIAESHVKEAPVKAKKKKK